MSESMLVSTSDASRIVDPDAELLARLRRGDEAAFLELVERYGPMMLRIALTYVRTRSIAEEVVQETWIGVLRSLERFQGRSTLRTWLLRILANRARTRGAREARCMPFSALAGEEPSVDPERFQGADGRFPGGWAAFPRPWETLPEERMLARETLLEVEAAIRALPGRQQEVIVLRDVEGWSAEEVCEALALSAANQRAAAPRPLAGSRRARALHGGGMTCRQLVELVTDYLEGGLPEPERERFDAHLATCPGCVTYLEQMRTTVRLAHETKALERRPEVIALLRAFRDWQASSTG